MKKKVFSLLAVVMFSGSLVSVYPKSSNQIKEIGKDCYDLAFEAFDEILDLGFSNIQATCIGNVRYAECAGWEVSQSDYRDCMSW